MRDQSSKLLSSAFPEIVLPIDPPSKGPGLAQVVRITGTERVSGPFCFDVEFTPRNRPLHAHATFIPPEDLRPEKLVGREAAIELSGRDDGNAWIHGMISRFATVPVGEAGAPFVYRIRIVPWLSLLDMKVNCRIFEGLSVADILPSLLEGYAYEILLHDSYEQRSYCCQFDESDFNFFSRLLEEEGIFYYFQHEKSRHSLVIADKNEFRELKGPEQAVYGQAIKNWQAEYRLHSGKFSVSDFEEAGANVVEGSESAISSSFEDPIFDINDLELFRFPGNIDSNLAARQRARVGIEREESCLAVHRGLGNRADFRAGARFSFVGHPDNNLNALYFLTEVHHSFDLRLGYRNSFTCLPIKKNLSFRPRRTAARPTVPGPQTAIVIKESPGPDLPGSIRVRFHWDRKNQNSCWIRVAEMVASNGWGTWFPPQIDDEVMVEFLNGNPDRPVVTGRLYNGANTPAETDANVIAIQTKNGQRLRFEDSSGRGTLLLEGTGDITIVDAAGNEISFGTNGITITSPFEVTVTSANKVTVQASQVEVAAGMITLNAAMTRATGVIQCNTLIATSVVSTSYTPGAGNIW